jgi:hypothetical protein
MGKHRNWEQISPAIAFGIIAGCGSDSREPESASLAVESANNPPELTSAPPAVAVVDPSDQAAPPTTVPVVRGTPAATITGETPSLDVNGSDPGDAMYQPGSATVRWTPPTRNTDGSPLADLQGYRILYGTSASNLSLSVDIPHAGIASAVIEDLPTGTWHFAARAYNSRNVESALSNVASKTIR